MKENSLPYFKNRVCVICGKIMCFYGSDPYMWVFRFGEKFCCSWTCFRAFQKQCMGEEKEVCFGIKQEVKKVEFVMLHLVNMVHFISGIIKDFFMPNILARLKDLDFHAKRHLKKLKIYVK